MLTPLDYSIIIIYLVGVAVLGILVSGKQSTTADYFLGGRNLPWWAVCFSIVATETSTLTVIGVPAVSYLGTLTFLQITFGYLLGRVLVSILFLPKYFDGELKTAYALLGNRFGDKMRASASLTFMVTRLLADGVRLFATAIPIKVIAQVAGYNLDYWQIIVCIGLITIVYTYIGGIKAVVWMDVVQMLIYVGGAIFALVVLLNLIPDNWWQLATDAGKTKLFDFNPDWLSQPYTFVTALVGGAIFSMASHGTDQLIVQRLLTCKNEQDSKKALIMSGVIVMFQFALFLGVGLLLWVHYNGAPLSDLGLTRGDEVFPKFIIEGLPAGISGLMLAGIIAAAMSTLSSSLNALASSSVLDIYERFTKHTLSDEKNLQIARFFTLVWGIIFIVFATLFEDDKSPVVELGLAIASYTYGGLLGVFFLGIWNQRATQTDAIISFFTTILIMTIVIKIKWFAALFGLDATKFPTIAWPLYTVFGAILLFAIGSALSFRHKRA